MYMPTIWERTGRGEKQWDLPSRLLQDRIIFLDSGIDDTVASVVCSMLLILEKESSDQEIRFYINSPGGSVTAGLAIYDTMQLVNCEIQTVCIGQAASMGAVLLAAGTEGKRLALPSSRIMLHQPWGGAEGTAADITIQASEIGRLKGVLSNILAKHIGVTTEEILEDTDRDFYMSPDQAKEYGIIDTVFSKEQG
ncbi:MAG: ATP-dependent Clp protease proteolytic subunit [Planctomycetota bacterium]|nr:MAG: ATP-dependent Clp protease proteolytic subunit [Planctomycetota bacterium]